MEGRVQSSGVQASLLRQIIGIIIGPLLVYSYTIWISIQGESGDSSPQTIWGWTTAIAFYAVGLAGWLFVVYRFVCGQPLSRLNRQPGRLKTDLLQGLILAVILGVVNKLFYLVNWQFLWLESSGQVEGIYADCVANPWSIVMLLGPYTFLAAAMYEEFLRVFLLERVMSILPGSVGMVTVMTVSAILFSLCHVYQGPAGIVNSLLFGIVLAAYYCKYGRILPLIVGHGVYNFVCISMGLLTTAIGRVVLVN